MDILKGFSTHDLEAEAAMLEQKLKQIHGELFIRDGLPHHESDPTGRAANEPGAKLDAGKPRMELLGDFGLALKEVAKVATFGAKKYSDGGWQEVPDGPGRYTGALWRHLTDERYEKTDSDSGLLHAAQVAWNALARLELMLRK